MTEAIRQALSELFNADSERDYLVISRGVSRALHAELTEAVSASRKHNKCTVFLTTYGGDAHAAYRIARCLRHNYAEIRLVVPSFCKSAGTLIAIGASELVIGDLGELGPLDIQVSKPLEFNEQGSGLDIQQALEVTLEHSLQAFRKTLLSIRYGGRLSTKLAGDFASQVVAGIAAPLYAQIDPNRLGELQRAMQIAHEYGSRLDKYSSNLQEGALNRLIVKYPSHEFVIDRKEAKELFKKVGKPSNAEVVFCKAVWHVVGDQSDIGPAFLERPEQAIEGVVDAEDSRGVDGESKTTVNEDRQPEKGSTATDGASVRVRRNGRTRAAFSAK